MKTPDHASLQKRRGIVIADLLAKAETEDWHGVADAAMDLREIDAQLALLIGAPKRYTTPDCPHVPACGRHLECLIKQQGSLRT